jgi:alkylhydroperoxidase family enzyme
MQRQFDTLYGYLALARRPGNAGGQLDDRTRMLVRRLAAERSGCRWCLDRVGHDWRAQGLTVDLLDQLGAYATGDAFTERERAALALVDAVARASADAGSAGDVLARVRRQFTERAVAELIACMAEHHLIADDHT